MQSLFTFVVFCLGLSGLLHAKSSTGDSVLVVVEEAKQKDYSIFFDSLKDQGYELTFRVPKDQTPPVFEFDVPTFSHIIVLSSETKTYGKDITPQSLIDLASSGTNLILTLSQKQTPLASLAAEFNLILPPPSTPLVSFFPEREEPLTVVPVPVPASHIVSSNTPVWFSGVPHALGNSPQLVPILKAPAESFAADVDSGADAIADTVEKGGEGLWAGSQLGLVTGFQVAGGARVSWVGSAEMFSNDFATKPVTKGVESGNAQFLRELVAWTFQESLVLRIDSTSHHLVNASEPLELYTTNDNLVYSAHISRFNPKTSTWVPYSGIDDMQLEFTMLDPHIRTALLPVAGSPGEYSVTFRAPDRHGVFKFVINYKRKGWTHLHSSTTVSVAPPRHDGYPRFLSAAWPYYAGAISTSVAFFLFSAGWLVGESREGKKSKGTKAQ